MAPLPVNSTSRLVVDYTWRGNESTVLYRFGTEIGQASAIGAINLFHAAVESLFVTQWSVPGSGVWYNALDNFGDDVVIAPIATGGAGSGSTTHPDSLQLQVVGRSAGGRKASWYFQGLGITLDATQRIQAGASVTVDAFLAAFSDLVGEGLTTINGLPPVLKPYVNIVFNDYLTRRSREGS